MSSKLWWIILIIVVGTIVYFFPRPVETKITNFEECVAAGNPATTSYPRQCRDDSSDRTFVEYIDIKPELN